MKLNNNESIVKKRTKNLVGLYIRKIGRMECLKNPRAIKTFLLVLVTVLFFDGNVAMAQRGMLYSQVKEISVPGKSQEKLYKKAKSWLEGTDDVKITRWNDDSYMIEATRTMPYENSLVLENIVLSPNAALRTKGKMTYTIKIVIFEGKVKIECTNFTHEAAYNRYGQISFGQILTNEKAPLGKCFEDTKWCNAVWGDMKTKINADVKMLMENAQKKLD